MVTRPPKRSPTRTLGLHNVPEGERGSLPAALPLILFVARTMPCELERPFPEGEFGSGLVECVSKSSAKQEGLTGTVPFSLLRSFLNMPASF